LALYLVGLNSALGWRVHLSMITRTAMLPYYRSDAMHAVLDRSPEQIAVDLRAHFAAA